MRRVGRDVNRLTSSRYNLRPPKCQIKHIDKTEPVGSVLAAEQNRISSSDHSDMPHIFAVRFDSCESPKQIIRWKYSATLMPLFCLPLISFVSWASVSQAGDAQQRRSRSYRWPDLSGRTR